MKSFKLKNTIALGYQRIIKVRKLKLIYEKLILLFLKKSLISINQTLSLFKGL